jgi:ankyrin repeat protein
MVNAKDNNGFTPLHGATFHGHEDVIEVLLAHGAEVNAKTSDGDTALAIAMSQGNKAVAALLRQHGGQE